MAEVMLALGDYRFSVDTAAFQSLSINDAWTWAEQSRVGREPILQLTGKSLTTISIAGNIYPEYKGGFGQVNAMRAEADKGKPLNLLAFDSTNKLATGVNLGQWVIVSISETQRVFRANGSPRAIEFSLQIKKYIP